MNLKVEEEKINQFLQKALSISLKYGDNTDIGKSILSLASKIAYRQLLILRFLKYNEEKKLYFDYQTGKEDK